MKRLAFRFLYLFCMILLLNACTNKETDIPYWLSDYKDLYEKNPTEASQQWFKDAKMGMFVHFTIGSLMEKDSDYNQWMSGNADERICSFIGISMEDYRKAESKDSLLFTRFEIPVFDAEKICQLAVKAKMKYITFTAHHQSCNFDALHASIAAFYLKTYCAHRFHQNSAYLTRDCISLWTSPHGTA